MSHSDFTEKPAQAQRRLSKVEMAFYKAAPQERGPLFLELMEERRKTAPPAYGRVIPPGERFKHNRVWDWFEKGWHFQVTKCPYCGKQHHHGWPEPGSGESGGEGSHRNAHCSVVYGGQYILHEGEDPDAVARKAAARNSRMNSRKVTK